MRKRLSSLTRRSVIGALVGLAFAAAAGVGLAQVTTGSTPSTAAASTTGSQTTSTQTTGDFAGKSADDQESESDFESDENEHQSSTTLSTTSPLITSTTGDDADGASGNGQVKQDVCHKPGLKQHTINIATPAVSAHLAHGDTIGACVAAAAPTPATTTTTATTSTATTTTSATSNGQNSHKPKKPKKPHSSNHGKGHNK